MTTSFTKKETELIIDNIGSLLTKIEKKKLISVDPVKTEIEKLDKVILDFVKTKKRKIYGGTAQNEAVAIKDKNDAFYDEDNISDIDIYSFDPINDMIEIANILHEKGFTEIHCTEAMHKETYAIFVNYRKALDLSYVNKFVYDSIQTVTNNGLYYVHPHVAIIDLYKMITDPYFSNNRWEKAVSRIYLLQKHYPFEKYGKIKNMDFVISGEKEKNGGKILPGTIPENIKKVKNDISSSILSFIKEKRRETCILFGEYALNKYLEKEEIKNPFLRIISTDYKEDCIAIIKELKKKYLSKLSIKEYYPVWNLFGYSSYITYDSYPVCSIVNYSGICVNTKIPKGEKIKIASFDKNLLYTMCLQFYAKMNRSQEMIKYFGAMINELISAKNEFFKKTKKTILDDTLFQQFIIDCEAKVIDPIVEKQIRKTKKFLARKLVTFNYRPDIDGVKKPESTYRFANTSGNMITNIKNYKIIPFLFEELPLLKKTLKENNKDKDIEKTFELVAEILNDKDERIKS